MNNSSKKFRSFKTSQAANLAADKLEAQAASTKSIPTRIRCEREAATYREAAKNLPYTTTTVVEGGN